mmetsp:Transcript_38771/g.82744  ORF Transcript_38771/g.82744 Transcript_38771/m.82744 type:complete len:240 (-) Transcript_38771:242-961(-)
MIPDSSSSSSLSMLSNSSAWLLLRLCSLASFVRTSLRESSTEIVEVSCAEFDQSLSPFASFDGSDVDISLVCTSAIDSLLASPLSSTTLSKAVVVALLSPCVDRREISTPPSPGPATAAASRALRSASLCSFNCCSRNSRCRSFIFPSAARRRAPIPRTPQPRFLGEASPSAAAASEGMLLVEVVSTFASLSSPVVPPSISSRAAGLLEEPRRWNPHPPLALSLRASSPSSSDGVFGDP